MNEDCVNIPGPHIGYNLAHYFTRHCKHAKIFTRTLLGCSVSSPTMPVTTTSATKSNNFYINKMCFTLTCSNTISCAWPMSSILQSCCHKCTCLHWHHQDHCYHMNTIQLFLRIKFSTAPLTSVLKSSWQLVKMIGNWTGLIATGPQFPVAWFAKNEKTSCGLVATGLFEDPPFRGIYPIFYLF